MSFTKDKDTDNYSTDKIGWEIIKDYIPQNKTIWSPFYNDGLQKTYFKDLFNLDIIHEDKDFFSYTPEYDLIIDNPPFSKFKIIFTQQKRIAIQNLDRLKLTTLWIFERERFGDANSSLSDCNGLFFSRS